MLLSLDSTSLLGVAFFKQIVWWCSPPHFLQRLLQFFARWPPFKQQKQTLAFKIMAFRSFTSVTFEHCKDKCSFLQKTHTCELCFSFFVKKACVVPEGFERKPTAFSWGFLLEIVALSLNSLAAISLPIICKISSMGQTSWVIFRAIWVVISRSILSMIIGINRLP